MEKLCLLLTVSCILSAGPCARADVSFLDDGWGLCLTVPLGSPKGIVQSICVAGDRIITLENYGDGSGHGDIVRAYSLDGLSLTGECSVHDYGHANGMAYHPGRHVAAVAPYCTEDPEDSGCVYLMDPDTLSYAGKVHVLDEGEVLGIGYHAPSGGYIIRTDRAGGFGFYLLDADFRALGRLPCGEDARGWRDFQDLCVSGDYIVDFPLPAKGDPDDYVNVYSVSDGSLLSCRRMALDVPGAADVEPESICEAAPGVFYMAVKVVLGDGSRWLYLYRNMVPVDFPAMPDGIPYAWGHAVRVSPYWCLWALPAWAALRIRRLLRH